MIIESSCDPAGRPASDHTFTTGHCHGVAECIGTLKAWAGLSANSHGTGFHVIAPLRSIAVGCCLDHACLACCTFILIVVPWLAQKMAMCPKQAHEMTGLALGCTVYLLRKLSTSRFLDEMPDLLQAGHSLPGQVLPLYCIPYSLSWPESRSCCRLATSFLGKCSHLIAFHIHCHGLKPDPAAGWPHPSWASTPTPSLRRTCIPPPTSMMTWPLAPPGCTARLARSISWM